MAIKNIIFDFGGVLMDWNPRYLYKNVFADENDMEYFLANICNMEWNVKQDAGRSFSEATKELVAKFPKYEKQIRMYYGQWQDMISGPIQENVALLSELDKNYELYGLTNWSDESFSVVFEQNDFFKVFNGIVVSGREKVIKPGVEIYKILISRYKLEASECLFIDDSKANIETAESLCFKTIHLSKGVNLEKVLQEKLNTK